MLDGTVATFCAVGRVQPQSETVWRQADKYGVPKIAYINKMDRVGADFFAVIDEMKEKLGARAVPICIPIGAEDKFDGIIDLVAMKAMIYDHNSDALVNYQITDIPEKYVDEANAWREKLVESGSSKNFSMRFSSYSAAASTSFSLHMFASSTYFSGISVT